MAAPERSHPNHPPQQRPSRAAVLSAPGSARPMTTSSIILKSMTLKPVTPLMSPALWIATCLTLLLIACGSGGQVTPPPPPTTYVLTVNSASPASSVSIAVTPSDNNNSGNGATSFTRTYNAGTSV